MASAVRTPSDLDIVDVRDVFDLSGNLIALRHAIGVDVLNDDAPQSLEEQCDRRVRLREPCELVPRYICSAGDLQRESHNGYRTESPQPGQSRIGRRRWYGEEVGGEVLLDDCQVGW